MLCSSSLATLNYRTHRDGGHGESLVRIGKASRASIKVVTDSEVCDEHTIKVVHRKKGCEIVLVSWLVSCPERLITVH